MIDDYRKLMSKASRLYEKHEASRPEPFNLFSILLSAISPEYVDALSVLRSEVHEVNFHSRFLQALLAHRRPPDGRRENLADFLRMPAARLSTLNPDQAVLDRESGRGVLIRDPVLIRVSVAKIGCSDVWKKPEGSSFSPFPRVGERTLHSISG